MFALERQKKILEVLSRDGVVSVSRLSEDLQVTEETVRRDLEKLEKQELLRRTHGGALPMDDTSSELSLKLRKSTNTEAKERLAKKATDMIVSGDTVFLDASTTTFCMAKELKKRRQKVTVITNSLRVINELEGCDSVKLIGVGGMVSENQSFVGRFAENSIAENYFANKLFFSGKGIVKGSGILDSNETECAIKQQMMKNSDEKYFLCDKSKLGKIGFIKLAEFEEVDYIITEEMLDDEWKAELDEIGVEIIV